MKPQKFCCVPLWTFLLLFLCGTLLLHHIEQVHLKATVNFITQSPTSKERENTFSSVRDILVQPLIKSTRQEKTVHQTEVDMESFKKYMRREFKGNQTCDDPGSGNEDLPPNPSRTNFNCSTAFQTNMTQSPSHLRLRQQIRIWCDPDTGASYSEMVTVTFEEGLQTFRSNESISCLKRYISEHCTDEYPVPSVIHIIYFGISSVAFRNAIGFYSIFTVAKPCLVLQHGDGVPSGYLWDVILPAAMNMVHVHREPLSHINGNKIKYVQTKADIARIDVLQEYGGIYLDSDMVILHPIDIFRAVQFAANKAGSNSNLANGIMLSVPGAPLLKIWRDRWKTYRGTSWNSHSVLLLTKLARQHKDLMSELGPIFIKFGPANQGQLYRQNCHLRESYAMHLYKRDIPAEASFEYVKRANTTFGRVARYILFGDSRICQDDNSKLNWP